MTSPTRKKSEVDDFSYRRYEDMEHDERKKKNELTKITDADFDEDDLDFQGFIEKYLGKKTLDRITAMREKELAKVTAADNSEKYEEFLDLQAKAFTTARLLKSNLSHLTYQNSLPTMVAPELQAEVTNAGATIHKMLLKLAVIPYSAAVHKKMELLSQVADTIHEYSINPTDPGTVVRMTENLIHLNHIKNPFWKPLKIALCAVIGAACIGLGLLGIVPSFGASVGLIAVGAALCIYAGVKSFTHFLPKPRESLAGNLATMLNHTHKLLSTAEEPELKPAKPR